MLVRELNGVYITEVLGKNKKRKYYMAKIKKNVIKKAHDFEVVYSMIIATKNICYKQINSHLIQLYWNIGQYISKKVEQDKWGQNTVEELSRYIQTKYSGAKGFSARNIWRMKQFYETYVQNIELSAVLTEITWTNHLHILSKTKTFEEKRYYLELCSNNHYSERSLARLIDSGAYERTFLANQKMSAALTEFPVDVTGIFKDSYVFEFLNLPETHQEKDLRRALITHLKQFLFEMGPDFTLMGEEYVIQVGKKDFKIDLLMFHRGLNCMVALELKSIEFHPQHLGQLQFYLEALDQDIKKPHENPSIGILICKTKDDEVVKYALNRHASPTMIAEYETKFINKALLEQKIHELSQNLQIEMDKDGIE